MKYQIEVSKILPPDEGSKYENSELVYKQRIETDDETLIVQIVDAINK